MWRMAYLLIPLGRGGRGGSSCRGGVRNGGLRWPEWTSKSDLSALLKRLELLLPSPKPRLGCWNGEGASGDDGEVQGGQSWRPELLNERVKERVFWF